MKHCPYRSLVHVFVSPDICLLHHMSPKSNKHPLPDDNSHMTWYMLVWSQHVIDPWVVRQCKAASYQDSCLCLTCCVNNTCVWLNLDSGVLAMCGGCVLVFSFLGWWWWWRGKFDIVSRSNYRMLVRDAMGASGGMHPKLDEQLQRQWPSIQNSSGNLSRPGVGRKASKIG